MKNNLQLAVEELTVKKEISRIPGRKNDGILSKIQLQLISKMTVKDTGEDYLDF